MNVPFELLTLLVQSEHFPLAQQLLQEMSGNQGFDPTPTIALQQVRDIYRQRARHIERTGYPIHGFPELVKGLEAFTRDSITIFNVRFNSGDYAVFADPTLSELAGILKFPKKTAAQEATLADSRGRHEAMLASSRLQTV